TDQLNQPELGWAALRNGKVDMAEALLRGSLKSYSAQTGTIYLNLAQVVQQRVSQKLSHGKPAELAAQLAEADRYLELVPVKSPNLALVDARRRVQATEWALKAEIHRMAREDDKMVVCLREALRIAPEDAMAPRWKAEIDRAAPQRFSLGGPR